LCNKVWGKKFGLTKVFSKYAATYNYIFKIFIDQMDGLSSRDIRNYALSTITAIQPSDSVADLTDVSFFI